MADTTSAPDSGFDNLLRAWFRTESRAFLTVCMLMIAWIAAYAYFHRGPSIPSSEIEGIVQRSPVGYLGVTYDDALLETLFPLTAINELKVEINSELDQARNFLIEPRRRALREAGVFACTTLSSRYVPSDLVALGAKGELGGATCAVASGMDAPSDDLYIYADIEAILAWYKSVCPTCGWLAPTAEDRQCAYSGMSGTSAPESVAPPRPLTGAETAADPLDGIIAPDKRALYYYLVHELSEVQVRENSAFHTATCKVHGLFEGLQFNFLRLRGKGWILELAFWSVMGVLGNTLAGLIEAWRKKGEKGVPAYDPEHFMLLIPKMVLAPVMSLVVVAMVFNGWLEVELNLSNQPVFLVLAFALGYASEKVNAILRRSINKLVSKLELSDTNFDKSTSAKRMLTQAWTDVKTTPVQPSTIDELAQEASRQAMAVAGPAVLQADKSASA